MNKKIKNLEENKEEMQKCKDSPVYFYNNYARKEGEKELTEEEYNYWLEAIEKQRKMPLKLRGDYTRHYPLTINEAFKK